MRRILLLGCLPISLAIAADDDAFQSKVWPILRDSCIRCHGAERQKGHLRLDSRAAILTGGKSGPSAIAGKPEDSLLIKAVQYTDDDLKMPPRKQLSAEQVAALSDWIKRGLPWPETGTPGDGQGAKADDKSAPKTDPGAKP